MGRPIVGIYSNSSCTEELIKVQDTYVYKMGNINSVVKDNGVNLNVYIKNSGELNLNLTERQSLIVLFKNTMVI